LTWWLTCRELLKIVYLLTCRVLGLAVLVFYGDLAKDAELLVVRHVANAVAATRRRAALARLVSWRSEGERRALSPAR
jgi:hypothetical protein